MGRFKRISSLIILVLLTVSCKWQVARQAPGDIRVEHSGKYVEVEFIKFPIDGTRVYIDKESQYQALTADPALLENQVPDLVNERKKILEIADLKPGNHKLFFVHLDYDSRICTLSVIYDVRVPDTPRAEFEFQLINRLPHDYLQIDVSLPGTFREVSIYKYFDDRTNFFHIKKDHAVVVTNTNFQLKDKNIIPGSTYQYQIRGLGYNLEQVQSTLKNFSYPLPSLDISLEDFYQPPDDGRYRPRGIRELLPVMDLFESDDIADAARHFSTIPETNLSSWKFWKGILTYKAEGDYKRSVFHFYEVIRLNRHPQEVLRSYIWLSAIFLHHHPRDEEFLSKVLVYLDRAEQLAASSPLLDDIWYYRALALKGIDREREMRFFLKKLLADKKISEAALYYDILHNRELELRPRLEVLVRGE